MKKTITALILLLNILVLKAQSLELQNFSSAGDQLTSAAGISLSNILGEITTEGLEESDLRLTQGFHQLFKIISHSNDVENSFEIIVYPNPTVDEIMFKTEGMDNKRMIHIYNLRGQQVCFSEYSKKTLSIPFSDYPTGQYFAIVRDEQGKIIDQIPFQKI